MPAFVRTVNTGYLFLSRITYLASLELEQKSLLVLKIMQTHVLCDCQWASLRAPAPRENGAQLDHL